MNEKMIAKIGKLLALAERAGTPEEAQAASEKAERLMVQYGIEEAMARAAGGAEVKPEEIVEKFFPTPVKSWAGHQINLMYKVARGMGLDGYQRGNIGFYVVGHESDVERFTMLANSVVLQAMSAMKKWWKQYGDHYRYHTGHQQKVAKADFLGSFGSAVMHRLEEMNKEETEAVPGSALVLRNRRQEVADHIEGMNLRESKARGYGGSVAGYAAGRSANLGEKSLAGQKQIG